MNPIRKLLSDNFLRNNVTLFVGSMLAAALNYLFYPVLGRLMDLAPFGETQALVSMFMQVTIFFTVATVVITNIVANAEKGSEEYRALHELQRVILLIALSVFTIILLAGTRIQAFFQFESVWPIYALAVSLLLSMPLTIRIAFLRGKQRFPAVSVSGIISAGFKLLFATALVLLGMQTFGAIAGIVLAQLVALTYTAWQARKVGFERPPDSLLKKPDLGVLLPQLRYAGFVTVITFVVTFQFSVDILVIKRYFDPETAGLYAGIATAARILYFLTASVAAVLLSSVQMSDTSGDNRRLLVKSGIITAALGGSALLVFTVVPDHVIRLLMGSTYVEFATLLPWLSLAIFLVSIANLVLTYCMALRFYGVMVPTVIGAMVTYGLLWLHHGTPEQVVQSLLIGSIALLLLTSIWAIMQISTNKNRHGQQPEPDVS